MLFQKRFHLSTLFRKPIFPNFVLHQSKSLSSYDRTSSPHSDFFETYALKMKEKNSCQVLDLLLFTRGLQAQKLAYKFKSNVQNSFLIQFHFHGNVGELFNPIFIVISCLWSVIGILNNQEFCCKMHPTPFVRWIPHGP